MLVLLDESLPRAPAAELIGHNVSTLQGEGWAGAKNGDLLGRACERFDAPITMDRGLQHQQNLRFPGLRVVIVRASSNRMDDLKPLIGGILNALGSWSPGRVREVEG